MTKFFLYIQVFVFGNVVSLINARSKNVLKFILYPKKKTLKNGNFGYLLNLSDVIEKMPSWLVWNFNCYNRALTGRWILNLNGVRSSLYLGFISSDKFQGDRLHSWLTTEYLDVCGYEIAYKYQVMTKYD